MFWIRILNNFREKENKVRVKKNNFNKKGIKVSLGIFVIILLFSITIFIYFTNNNEVDALSKYGSRGDEVRQIQEKLKRWGYYNGNVDGIFGSQTLEAVKYFQRKNGLTVDGIAGPATLKAMGIYSANSKRLYYCRRLHNSFKRSC